MYVRWLFVLLAALNLGAAGWLLFAGSPSRAMPPATDPGVPELRLASEAAPVGRALTAAKPGHVAGAAAAATADKSVPATSSAAHAPVASSGSQPAAVVPPTSSSTKLVASAASAPAPIPSGEAASASIPVTSARAQRSAAAAPASSTAASARTHAASATSSTLTVGQAEACTSLGPFTTEADMRSALAALSPHVARIRHREAEVSRPHGYWVFLPPAVSRSEAQAEARALAAKGVRDYYITGGGDTPNAISLGVYNDAVNAQNRVTQVEKLGFAAQVKRRVDAEPVYWLDFAVAKGATFQWQPWLPDHKGLATKATACF